MLLLSLRCLYLQLKSVRREAGRPGPPLATLQFQALLKHLVITRVLQVLGEQAF